MKEKKIACTDVAKIYNVNRSTLSRGHRKIQAPKEEQAINLITLTEKGLPPTRKMITSFSRKLGKRKWERGGWIDLWLEQGPAHHQMDCWDRPQQARG
jgi:hypothetical protein